MVKEQLNKEELEKKKTNLEKEIEALESAIKATDSHAFDLIIAEIKREMENNIAEEDWKTLKQNQKKIEAFNQIEQIIESQSDLLDKKQEELEDVIYDIEHYQMTLDDIPQELQKENAGIHTNITLENGEELVTGDIYAIYPPEGVDTYYLVKKSAEVEGKFAIMSNTEEGELFLNYPKNLNLLNKKEIQYVGNIYLEDANQNEAIECLKIIADFQNEDNTEQ